MGDNCWQPQLVERFRAAVVREAPTPNHHHPANDATLQGHDTACTRGLTHVLHVGCTAYYKRMLALLSGRNWCLLWWRTSFLAALLSDCNCWRCLFALNSHLLPFPPHTFGGLQGSGIGSAKAATEHTGSWQVASGKKNTCTICNKLWGHIVQRKFSSSHNFTQEFIGQKGFNSVVTTVIRQNFFKITNACIPDLILVKKKEKEKKRRK